MANPYVLKNAPKTGVPFCNFADYYGRKEYLTRLFKLLDEYLVKVYGNTTRDQVLGMLNSNRIVINNIECFLSGGIIKSCYDPSNIMSSSPLDYTCKLLLECKKLESIGFTNVTFRYLIPSLARAYKKATIADKRPLVNYTIQYLLTLLSGYSRASNYNIEIMDKELFEASDFRDLKYPEYASMCSLFITSAHTFAENNKGHLYPPKITVLHSIFSDLRSTQLLYLYDIFKVPKFKMKELEELSEGIDLGVDSPSLRNILEYLVTRTGRTSLDYQYIINELGQLKDRCTLKKYVNKEAKIIDKITTERSHPYVDHEYVDLRSILNKEASAAEVVIPCKGCSLESILSRISLGYIVCFARVDLSKNIGGDTTPIHKESYKVILKDVEVAKDSDVDVILERVKEIQSYKNKNLLIEIKYTEDFATKKVSDTEVTHIRVISDMHVDINKNRNYCFNFGNDYIINCGDTSGNCVTTVEWIKDHMKVGAFVHGNHMGYDRPYPERDGKENIAKYGDYCALENSAPVQVKYLHANFVKSKDIHFLQKNSFVYNGVLFTGGCLYSNFDMYGEDNIETCKHTASKMMNDFRYPMMYKNGYYVDDEETGKPRLIKEPIIRTMQPMDYQKYYRHWVYSIKEILRTNARTKKLPVVIVSHFAPFPFSIQEEYRGELLNAAFANNLDFEMPYVRLFLHGHVHKPVDYIYNGIRVIAEPFGYYNENNFNTLDYGKRISFDDIKSKKEWTEIVEGIKVYTKDDLDEFTRITKVTY